MEMESNQLFAGAVQMLILLLAISVHEAAHAWTAARCGDQTAQQQGRLTLNPIRHLDLFGSLIVPIVLLVSGGPIFGWGKPTPVRLASLRKPARDHLLFSLAGPAANALLSLFGLMALAVALQIYGPGAAETASAILIRDLDTAAAAPQFPILFTLVHWCFLNGFLAVFHLLPVPPLDGGAIVLNLLPPDWAQRYFRLQPYGFIIVLGLAMLNVLVVLVVPVFVLIQLVIQMAA